MTTALPEINKLTLYSGYSSGGYSVGVFGTFDDFPLYCKFGTVPCLTPCTRVNGSYAICPGFLFIFKISKLLLHLQEKLISIFPMISMIG
jgi:hypothetical protein